MQRTQKIFHVLVGVRFSLSLYTKKQELYKNKKSCSKRHLFSVIIYIRDKSQSFYYGYL